LKAPPVATTHRSLQGRESLENSHKTFKAMAINLANAYRLAFPFKCCTPSCKSTILESKDSMVDKTARICIECKLASCDACFNESTSCCDSCKPSKIVSAEGIASVLCTNAAADAAGCECNPCKEAWKEAKDSNVPQYDSLCDACGTPVWKGCEKKKEAGKRSLCGDDSCFLVANEEYTGCIGCRASNLKRTACSFKQFLLCDPKEINWVNHCKPGYAGKACPVWGHLFTSGGKKIRSLERADVTTLKMPPAICYDAIVFLQAKEKASLKTDGDFFLDEDDLVSKRRLIKRLVQLKDGLDKYVKSKLFLILSLSNQKAATWDETSLGEETQQRILGYFVKAYPSEKSKAVELKQKGSLPGAALVPYAVRFVRRFIDQMILRIQLPEFPVFDTAQDIISNIEVANCFYTALTAPLLSNLEVQNGNPFVDMKWLYQNLQPDKYLAGELPYPYPFGQYSTGMDAVAIAERIQKAEDEKKKLRMDWIGTVARKLDNTSEDDVSLSSCSSDFDDDFSTYVKKRKVENAIQKKTVQSIEKLRLHCSDELRSAFYTAGHFLYIEADVLLDNVEGIPLLLSYIIKWIKWYEKVYKNNIADESWENFKSDNIVGRKLTWIMTSEGVTFWDNRQFCNLQSKIVNDIKGIVFSEDVPKSPPVKEYGKAALKKILETCKLLMKDKKQLSQTNK
jgi:hypothetical protein